jgi:hypothetical protein
MSKKNKIRKKISPQPETGADKKPAIETGVNKADTANTITLINFDRKTKIFLSLLLAGFLLLSLLKIHTSNIANWDLFFGQEKSASVIAGKPRFIRMDEWMISTTATISQYNKGMPVKNEAIGDLNTPVIWGLPIKDASTILRPYLWPYFVADVETAFAFSWNFNVFFFLIGTFLLLMLLTRNNFWLSVTGTFFIFLSGALQWWSYFIGNYMLYLNGMFISFAYLLYGKKKWQLIFSGSIFIFSVFGFLFGLYPPFQVPLVYLYLFLFLGFLWQRKNFSLIKDSWVLKTTVLTVSLIVLGIFTFHYYTLVSETYTAMLNTVYPGRRVSTGGDIVSGKLFSEFFGMFMTDTHTPKVWMNICEASNFIMFFPVVFYAMGYYILRTKKTEPLLLAASAFVIVSLIYVLIGFPEVLSRLTLFSMSPAFRTLPVLGVGNCFLLILFIASPVTHFKNEKISWIELALLAISSFVFMRIVASQINNITENYFPQKEVAITTALVIASYILIRYKNFRFAKPALYIVLISMVIANLSINPVTKGLDPILENPVYKAVDEIYKKDPLARWTLFGNTRLTHILKATGINMFNTVKMVPPMKDMKFLDPAGVYDSIYNRYAWMKMNKLIGYNDTVVFRQTFNDGYSIFVDPCSLKLKQLNVKYFAFDYVPEQAEIRCMIKLADVSGVLIYKRID